jgi:hypothetical protein
MRSKSILIVLGLATLMFLGAQVLTPLSRALTIPAEVDITPETLNLNRNGRWITVHIELPKGYNVTDVDESTILLEGLFSPEWSNVEDGRLMVKFDASGVIDYLWDRLYHMGGKAGSIELSVAGQLMDGTQFSGTDKITIMDPCGN